MARLAAGKGARKTGGGTMMDALEEATEITVLGIGNIVLRDEGFGVRVAEYLTAHYTFPDCVQVLDGGTLGMELLRFVAGTKRLLLLDAVRGDKAPGETYRLAGAEVEAHFQDKLSAHEIGVQDILTLLTLTGQGVPEVVVLGAEPVDMAAGMALSPALSALVPEMARRAVDELARWGAAAKEKVQEARPCV